MTQPQPDCPFCKIARQELPAIILYEDAHTLAFMDIYPASSGHSLVVSKQHYADFFTIDASALAQVMATSQCLARAIQQALQPDGLRVMQFNGAAAGQTVFHYHVHLRPAYAHSGQEQRSHSKTLAERSELERLAQRIRAALS